MGNINDQELTPRIFLKQLSIIHLALLGGQISFAVIVYSMQKGSLKIDSTNYNDIFLYIIIAAAISGILAGNFIYKKLLQNTITKKNTLKGKLMSFQTTSIIKYALLEAPSFLALFLYMSYGNLLYLLIAGILLVYLYFQKPTKEKLITDLNLNGENRSKLNKLDDAIK